MGPKGLAAARRTGDGVVLTGLPGEPLEDRWAIRGMLTTGTVLQPGEDHTSQRVRDAAGPFHAMSYHAIWEWAPAALANMPGGADWLAALAAERPEGERHLAVHEGHFVTVTDRDRPLLDAGGPAILAAGWTGDAASIRQKVAAATAAGITEVLYSPAGPDIPGEIEAFAAAVRS
jgi:5,10-methylenetetrahydromethanopterin reductase